MYDNENCAVRGGFEIFSVFQIFYGSLILRVLIFSPCREGEGPAVFNQENVIIYTLGVCSMLLLSISSQKF